MIGRFINRFSYLYVHPDYCRYLSVTYQHIFNFVQPDVVIFLGDLFDEGSIATELDFKDYVERLLEIFSIKQNSNIQVIKLTPSIFFALIYYFYSISIFGYLETMILVGKVQILLQPRRSINSIMLSRNLTKYNTKI